VLRLLTLRLCIVQKGVLSLSKGTLDCFPWIVREIRVLDDELVQLISEIVRTCRPTMPIIDSEEGALWPLFILRAIGRLHYVEDYGYPVFIVSPNDALMCINSIASNAAMSTDGTLCA
jgi:hypothetical protein